MNTDLEIDNLDSLKNGILANGSVDEAFIIRFTLTAHIFQVFSK